MKNNKVKLILSIVFTCFAIISFLYCLFLLGLFIYELNKIPPECTQMVCVNIEGGPIVLLIYVLSMFIIGIIDILAIFFSLKSRKTSKVATKLLTCNIVMLVIQIIILIIMAIIV